MMGKCGVYSITNIKNGKVYIGSSKNIKERWWQHKYELKLNKHSNEHLQRSYNKYGEDAFKFQVIDYCEENERHALEQNYINAYKKHQEVYNIAPVGQPPIVHMSGETNGMYRNDVPPPDIIANEYMNNDISIKGLAEKYNCGVNTIRRRLDKSNINTHKQVEQLTTYQKQVPTPKELLNEYEQGNVTHEDLAKKYNCSKITINHRLRKARGGTQPFKHQHVPDGVQLLKEYENSDITQKQMADKYNCTVSCIEYRLKVARQTVS